MSTNEIADEEEMIETSSQEGTNLGNKEGVVKWFNSDKGYGFVTIEGEERDIFAHFTEIHVDGFKSLTEGSKVSFDLFENDKGLVARDIKIIEAAAPSFDNEMSSGGIGSNGEVIRCSRTRVNVSSGNRNNKQRLIIEADGKKGTEVIERVWRSLMQYEGVGSDERGSVRTWLKIYSDITGRTYDTGGKVPTWVGSSQARDELKLEGLIK